MILISTPTSPFGRKIKIAAKTYGLYDRMQIDKGDPWTETDRLRTVNPLGKMPVLVTPEGQSIYDSGVILEYFDTLLDAPKLFPPTGRIDTLVFHALGDGLIEAGLLITYERMRRPAEFCYEPWIDHQRAKLARGLTSLAQRAPDPRIADAASIAVACALGYFDWRKQIDWRADFPPLVEWLTAFSQAHPAYEATAATH
ncbi:MAG: glutathione S-transferase N-terminal domain-containing protein [Beijerinckiaceae bacterium]|jgi:glutathione S-transferase|nr:glutathione S-transferase N-terminal domain-containing protein [Beijerinckiaceae bacterium]